MNTVFNFAPLWRFSIGFDHLFDLVDQAMRSATRGATPGKADRDHDRINRRESGVWASVRARPNAAFFSARIAGLTIGYRLEDRLVFELHRSGAGSAYGFVPP